MAKPDLPTAPAPLRNAKAGQKFARVSEPAAPSKSDDRLMTEAEKAEVVECCHTQVAAMLEALPVHMRADYLTVMSVLCIRMLEQIHGPEYIAEFLSDALKQMSAAAKAGRVVAH